MNTTRLEAFSDGVVAILVVVICRDPNAGSKLARAIGGDFKGKISIVGYLLGIGCAFIEEWISDILYMAVAAMWLIPDRRIARNVATEKQESA